MSLVSSQSAVFLDRDGVLNECDVHNGKPYAPRTLEKFRFLPGVKNALVLLKANSFLLIVVTNQPDVGNGLVEYKVVEDMHKILREQIVVDDIICCLHRQDENCNCRKPKPGMLKEAADRWNIDLKKSFMIGDRWSDVVAGQQAGCYTIFIDKHYSEALPNVPNAVVDSLSTAADFILSIRHE